MTSEWTPGLRMSLITFQLQRLRGQHKKTPQPEPGRLLLGSLQIITSGGRT
jgi:hypothetical protein